MTELPYAATWPMTDVDIACMDCDRIMHRGTPYATRLVAMTPDNNTLSEVVCVYCVVAPLELCASGTPDDTADLS